MKGLVYFVDRMVNRVYDYFLYTDENRKLETEELSKDAKDGLERRLDNYIGVNGRYRHIKAIGAHSRKAFCQLYELMRKNRHPTQDRHDTFYEQWVEEMKQARGYRKTDTDIL